MGEAQGTCGHGRLPHSRGHTDCSWFGRKVARVGGPWLVPRSMSHLALAKLLSDLEAAARDWQTKKVHKSSLCCH